MMLSLIISVGYLKMSDRFPNRIRKDRDDRPLTRAEKEKILRDFSRPIILNDPPRAITEKDGKFLFIILNALDQAPDVNWDLVADRAGYANATTARICYGRLRRQLRLYYAKEEPKIAPFYNSLMIPKALNGPSKSDKDKPNPIPARVVNRKSSKPATPWHASKKPTKFPRNHGQGLTINRNDDIVDPVQPRDPTEFKRIEVADDRDEFDSENEYQNPEHYKIYPFHKMP
ncbi:hypothetical protein EYC80_003094 [Monilinia laxa]|uniref:Myb-like domain-containing protein n=1 Tax=Monilinia laxa TaxID=61186 RepID=A0A5N6KCN4_MONLA|nr:hypothetical protein EYC80_003094 [Monilinia laxa]